MKTFRTIMVAVDFSDHSVRAAEHAAGLANDLNAKLLLTNIYNQRDVDMMQEVAIRVPEFSVKKHLDEHIRDRKQKLEDLAKKLDSGTFEIETTVQIGVPYEALLKEIEKQEPDLLVMGVKGRSDVVDMIVGSCAQKMFRRSPIPLMSTRSHVPE
ncbi:MAG: universal stress protein [Deltaproteobacteria bacterium]|nr:universal stress protein [Deltaproteobacteria bacterium]